MDYTNLITFCGGPIRGLIILTFLVVSSSTIFSQDSQAKLLEGASFTVPEADRADGIHGDIKVAIDVDKKGEVERAIVYVGPGWPCSEDFFSRTDKLMRSIEKAVSKYKFSPAIKDGKPTTARLSLSLKVPPAESNTGATLDFKRKLVNGGVMNGRATSLPKPAYPSAARAERAGGPVSVQVLIDEQGQPIWAQAISGHPLLMMSARDAACGAKFKATLLEGTPIKISGVITYNFVP